MIVRKIKIIIFNSEDEKELMVRQLRSFTSEEHYMDKIYNLKLDKMIDTAFMMDKVISSLPTIQSKFSKK